MSWTEIVGLLWPVLLAGGAYLWRQIHANQEAVRGLQAEQKAMREWRTSMPDIGTALARLETRMEALPTKDDLNRIELEVARLSGRVDRNAEALESVRRMVDRHERYLERVE